LHPISRGNGNNADKRPVITASLRGAVFGYVPVRSGAGVTEKEVKKRSPEMPCQNLGLAVD
jgi:hypothetical protein